MKNSNVVVAITVLVAVVISSVAFAEVPALINYQGRLTDNEGVPLNGSYWMTFGIYGDPESGPLKWYSDPRSMVEVEDGLFTYLLGASFPIDDDIFTDPNSWLEITVDGETIYPRVQLVSSPYAYHALRSDTASSVVDNSINSGSVEDGTLTGGDLLDEPGVSYVFSYSETALTGTTSEITSVNIYVPANGFVILHATGYFAQNHTSGSGNQAARACIDESPGTMNYTHFTISELPSNTVSGNHYTPFAIHTVYGASEGWHQYYLNADVYQGGSYHPPADDICRYHLTALYVPSYYGPRMDTAEPTIEFDPSSSTGR